jgi:hypothetical protein
MADREDLPPEIAGVAGMLAAMGIIGLRCPEHKVSNPAPGVKRVLGLAMLQAAPEQCREPPPGSWPRSKFSAGVSLGRWRIQVMGFWCQAGISARDFSLVKFVNLGVRLRRCCGRTLSAELATRSDSHDCDHYPQGQRVYRVPECFLSGIYLCRTEYHQ